MFIAAYPLRKCGMTNDEDTVHKTDKSLKKIFSNYYESSTKKEYSFRKIRDFQKQVSPSFLKVS